MVVDGRGGPFATTSVFALVLAVVAAASLVWNLLRLRQRRLPAGRVARGLRFAHTGVAIGLAVSATASVIRIWPLATPAWFALTALVVVAAAALGIVAPGPRNDLEDVVLDLDAVESRPGAGDCQLSPTGPPRHPPGTAS